jgi:flagellar hook-basal body complex protein FliE
MEEIKLENSIETLPGFRIREEHAPEGKGKSFGEMLKSSINEVDRLHKEADKALQDMALGKGKGIHETMIALEKAEISFQLMMQVRNKIIAAYEQVKNIA